MTRELESACRDLIESPDFKFMSLPIVCRMAAQRIENELARIKSRAPSTEASILVMPDGRRLDIKPISPPPPLSPGLKPLAPQHGQQYTLEDLDYEVTLEVVLVRRKR